jgi:hypothetical protein
MKYRASKLPLPLALSLVAPVILGIAWVLVGYAAPAKLSRSFKRSAKAYSLRNQVARSIFTPETSLETLPRIFPVDLAYIGAFRVPNQDNNSSPLGYGGHALTYDSALNGLYFGGHDWDQELCKIGIPSEIDLGQTGSILQNCTDVTEGRLGLIDDGTVKLGGTLLYNGRLIVSAYSYYDADGNQSVSHFSGFQDLTQTGDIQGPYQVGDWAGIVSGYMAPVPPAWQAELGGPALTGNCCLSIISRTSYGPAVSVFDPDEVGTANPVPAVPLLYYPASDPLAEWDAASPYFNGTTQIVGLAFPPGARSVLFFGRHGVGEFCYGTGEACNDPVNPYQGTHAYPYVHQVWAYDALDLMAVQEGDLQPWEVMPYTIWQLDEMDSTGSASISGAAYDPAGGRLYVTENYGDEPVVHVYQITVSQEPVLDQRLYLPFGGRDYVPGSR